MELKLSKNGRKVKEFMYILHIATFKPPHHDVVKTKQHDVVTEQRDVVTFGPPHRNVAALLLSLHVAM